METRICIRASLKQKRHLKSVANAAGISMTDYVRQVLFEQNPDISNEGTIYKCLSGDRFNYAAFGVIYRTQELTRLLVTKMYGDQAPEVISKSFTDTLERLEKDYGYKKISTNKD